jgi:hypothetical protein
MLFRITSRAHSITALCLPCQGPKQSWRKRRHQAVADPVMFFDLPGSEEGRHAIRKDERRSLFETPGIEPLRIASMVHEKNRVNCWAGGQCG